MDFNNRENSLYEEYDRLLAIAKKYDMVLSLSLIHISEPTRLLSISYAVFCLKKHTKTYVASDQQAHPDTPD